MIDVDHLAALCQILAPHGGYFVEAGANDGLRQSNTLLLERSLGWRGLLVEPSPAAFEQLQENRPSCDLVNAALVASSDDGQTLLGAFSEGQLTGTVVDDLLHRAPDVPKSIVQRIHLRVRRLFGIKPVVTLISVPTTTLSSELMKRGRTKVDFLSLDVEGYELEALRGIDLATIRPSLLAVEVRDSEAWELLNLLTLAGYVLAENLSSFSREDSPGWTGDHQDFLFVEKTILLENQSLQQMLLR